ncbi:MAG: T9SS type A sorting domain-containing protein, partial [Saprospiraceae bacterium]|nr:T9SS type A sorting domain-containing protein [Saprospiraceae bacterium]
SPVVTFGDVVTPGACPQESVITRTWTATDACGNSSTCVQTITVDDSTPPVITCPADVTIECTESSDPANTGSATATDNCDNSPVVTFGDVVTPGACPQESVITRTWTATDACGNSSTCVQTITIDDITPPTISCPDDDNSLTCLDQIPCPEVVMEQVSAVDACDPNPSLALIGDTGQPECVDGMFSRTYTFEATDECGNSSTCTVTFSGTCQEFCTLTQGGWGNEGGKYPWNDSDGKAPTQAIIDTLIERYGVNADMGSGGEYILIGVVDNDECDGSLMIYPECVTSLLPAGGRPGPLPGEHEIADAANMCVPTSYSDDDLSKNGRLRTVLAGQTVALQLNMWYSLEKFGSSLGAVLLEEACFEVSANLPEGILTVKDLLDTANYILGGCDEPVEYKKGQIGAINKTIDAINNYYHECALPNECDDGQVLPDVAPLVQDVFEDIEQAEYDVDNLEIKAYPNPASRYINLEFDGLTDDNAVIQIFDALGRLIIQKKVGVVNGASIEIELADNVKDGMYYVRVKNNDQIKAIPIVVTKGEYRRFKK